MLVIIGIVSVALAIIFIEFPMIKSDKNQKERYLFVCLLITGVGLNGINSLNINFPSLLDWLIIVYNPISQIVFN